MAKRSQTLPPFVELPDGRVLEYRIRTSARNRNLCLRITTEGSLLVSAPTWLGRAGIMAMVGEKSGWIAERLRRLQDRGALPAAAVPPPQTISFPALQERWQIAYRQGPGDSVRIHTGPAGSILVSGAVADHARCRAALQRWLARRAQETLGAWLDELGTTTGLRFRRLTVRNQRSRWGSCSVAGAISLNCKLLFLPADLIRYVLLHELCHLREHNHTASYWALLRRHEPAADILHQRMRAAWQQIPAWAHRDRGRTTP